MSGNEDRLGTMAGVNTDHVRLRSRHRVGVAAAAVLALGAVGLVPPASAAPTAKSKANTVVATVPVAGYEAGIAVDPVTGEVVTGGSLGVLTGISEATDQVTFNDGVVEPSSIDALAVDPTSGNVYIGDFAGNVVVYNEATYSTTATVPSSNEVLGLAINPGAQTVYATNYQANTVSVISEATNSVTTTIPVPSGPVGVAVDASRGLLWVTSYRLGSVTVINTNTNAVITTIPVSNGAGPYGIDVDPVTGEVFVPNYFTDTLSVISEATKQVTATIPLAGHSDHLVVDPANSTVYVPLLSVGPSFANDNVVQVLNEKTDKITANVTVGSGAATAAVDPALGFVYVVNHNPHGAGTVSVIAAGK